ncbi:MAG: universal stress protein [Thermomicrobiales bacterium]
MIAREAAARKAWLIAMATHGRGGLDRVLYGSVTEGVVRQSPVPVLLVRAWHAGNSQDRLLASSPILVPLDGSLHAEAALPVAALRRLRAAAADPRAGQSGWPLDPALTPDGMAASLFTEDRPTAEREARAYANTSPTRLPKQASRWISPCVSANRRRLSRRWPKSAALR